MRRRSLFCPCQGNLASSNIERLSWCSEEPLRQSSYTRRARVDSLRTRKVTMQAPFVVHNGQLNSRVMFYLIVNNLQQLFKIRRVRHRFSSVV